jgi:crotonobetainyl-CoA:carnitine CoA-transferase CaiB-like acyl-CoA transferase
MLSRMNHPELGEIVLPNSPLRYAGLPPMPLRPSPRLGEHTEAVLAEISSGRASE